MPDNVIAELQNRIKSLENEVRTLKDIEAIERLQRTYGYYLEHWMAQDIIDLFSDCEGVSLTLSAGTYLGKTGVRKYFERLNPDNEFLHQVMQLSGVVDVDADGKNATGRWYGFGAISIKRGKGVGQSFMSGIYISDYVKEDGIWKFKTLKFEQFYTAKPLEGWVKPDRLGNSPVVNQQPGLVDTSLPRVSCRITGKLYPPFSVADPSLPTDLPSCQWPEA